ncbi:MAG: helix-turn-helix domain-containing protein [Thermoanaerobaculia bacterium]
MFARLFGPRLRALREERGFTQREFAGRIGATVPQVSRYERGQALPAAETLVAIAGVLAVDFNTLLGVDTSLPPAPPIHDLPVLERFQEIQKLGKLDRDAVIRIIDAVIKSHEHESIETKHPRPRAARA